MRKLRNRFIVTAQCLAGLGMFFPPLTAFTQMPGYSGGYCPNPNNVAPLVITIENDTDVDLNILVPRSYASYVRPSENDESPQVVTNGVVQSVVPNSADEAPEIEDQQPLTEQLCYQDIRAMEDQTLYAHEKYTFRIGRSGFLSHLFVKFRMTPQEPYGEYELARWEYAEEGGTADATCDIEAAKDRFSIGCSGNNDINYPVMNINISHINRPLVPRPLINGGEPNAGPPSTP